MTTQELCNKLNTSPTELELLLQDGMVPGLSSSVGKFEFSDEEADGIMRAALFTLLGFAPSDILLMQENSEIFNAKLAERRDLLISDEKDDNKAAMVCQNIRREKTDYQSFDVQDHLSHVRELEAAGGHFYHPYGNSGVFTSVSGPSGTDSPFVGARFFKDTENPEMLIDKTREELAMRFSFPTKRFFARTLDDTIYTTILLGIIEYFFKLNVTGNYYLYFALFYGVYLVELLCEPLVLAVFGTTVGKLVMGIKLTDMEGGKLSIKQAYKRTFLMYRYGMGFLIPFYNVICEAKALSTARLGVTLPWDEKAETRITLKDRRFWRMLVLFFAIMLLSSISTSIRYAAMMPVNRGAITPEQFYENIDSVKSFLPTSAPIPDYRFVCDSNGNITALTLTTESSDQQISDKYSDIYFAILAFVGADPSVKSYNLFTTTKLDPIMDSFSDYSIEYKGYIITNQVSYEGYRKMSLSSSGSSYPDYYLYADGSENRSFTQTITITKVK